MMTATSFNPIYRANNLRPAFKSEKASEFKITPENRKRIINIERLLKIYERESNVSPVDLANRIEEKMNTTPQKNETIFIGDKEVPFDREAVGNPKKSNEYGESLIRNGFKFSPRELNAIKMTVHYAGLK